MFLYDKLGRQTARILPDGKREPMTYDLAGNLETRTDFMGRITSYTYDDNNRSPQPHLSGPEPRTSASPTPPTGRRETATDGRGTTTYGYDLRDRLVSLTQPGFGAAARHRLLGYSYDGNGNRLTLTATIGSQTHTTSYTYDDAGRLDVVTDPAGRPYDHGYDANGNRPVPRPPERHRDRLWLRHPQPPHAPQHDHPSSIRVIQSYAFTLGPAGNRTQDRRSPGPAAAAHARLQLRLPLPPDGRDRHGELGPCLQQDLRLRPRRQQADADDGDRPRRLTGAQPATGDDRLRL